MGSSPLAEAFVRVRPDTREFGPELKRDLEDNTVAADVGEKQGAKFGEAFTKEVQGRLRDSRGRFRKASEDIGDDLKTGVEKGGKDTAKAVESLFGQVSKRVRGMTSDMLDQIPGVGRALAKVVEVLPPEISIPVVVTVGTAAVSLAGSAVGGALLGGLGIGGIATAIIAQMNDPRIVSQAGALGQEVKTEIQAGSKELVPEISNAIGIWRTAAQQARGDINGIFDELHGDINPLAQGTAKAFLAMLPGLRAAVREAQPIIAVASHDLPIIGRTLGQAFERVARGSKGGAEGLHTILMTANGLIDLTGRLIYGFEEMFHIMLQGADKGAAAWAKLSGWLPVIGTQVHHAADQVHGLATSTDAAGMSFGDLKSDTSSLDKTTQMLNDTLSNTIDLFDRLFGKQMSVDEATLRYRQGLRDLHDEIVNNGRSLKEGTVVGDHNREAILQQIQAIEQLRAANVASGMSVDQANAAYNQQLDSLRTTLLQLGLNKDAVDAIIQSYKNVPASVTTHVSDPGAQAVLDRAKQLGVSLAAIPKDIRVKVGIYEMGSGTAYSYASPDRKYRLGGIQPALAARRGLLTDGGIAMAGSRPIIQFAEPGVGREGWVPEKGISQQRAFSLLSPMAAWHNLAVVPAGQAAAPTVVQPAVYNVVVSAKDQAMDALLSLIDVRIEAADERTAGAVAGGVRP